MKDNDHKEKILNKHIQGHFRSKIKKSSIYGELNLSGLHEDHLLA